MYWDGGRGGGVPEVTKELIGQDTQARAVTSRVIHFKIQHCKSCGNKLRLYRGEHWAVINVNIAVGNQQNLPTIKLRSFIKLACFRSRTKTKEINVWLVEGWDGVTYSPRTNFNFRLWTLLWFRVFPSRISDCCFKSCSQLFLHKNCM